MAPDNDEEDDVTNEGAIVMLTDQPPQQASPVIVTPNSMQYLASHQMSMQDY